MNKRKKLLLTIVAIVATILVSYIFFGLTAYVTNNLFMRGFLTYFVAGTMSLLEMEAFDGL